MSKKPKSGAAQPHSLPAPPANPPPPPGSSAQGQPGQAIPEPVFALAQRVEAELTAVDGDLIFRKGWDVAGPWSRARIWDEQRKVWRYPGSVPELRLSLRGYLDTYHRPISIPGTSTTTTALNLFKEGGRALPFLNDPDRWAPSVTMYWRMARIIVPAMLPLPELPTVSNYEDAVAALRVLDSALAQTGVSADGPKGRDTGRPSWIIADLMTAKDIAEKTGLGPAAETALSRFAKSKPDCRIEINNPRAGESRHLYRVRDVLGLITSMMER